MEGSNYIKPKPSLKIRTASAIFWIFEAVVNIKTKNASSTDPIFSEGYDLNSVPGFSFPAW